MYHLTEEQRHRICFEFQSCQNISKIAKKLKLSRKTVHRWIHRHQTVGNVKNRKRSGRKPSLDTKTAKMAMSMLSSNMHTSGQEVAKELFRQSLTSGKNPVAGSTVIRHAKAMARAESVPIHAVRRQPQKQLSQGNMAQRLEFCLANKSRNWTNVMFTDRKRFMFLYPGQQIKNVAWVVKGEPRLALKASNALCINLYAGITKFGVTRPHIVAGTSKLATQFSNQRGVTAKNITSAEYKQVLSNTLLPDGDRLFRGQGITNWIFQQDNDPSHKRSASLALSEWNNKHMGSSITLLPKWPPNSPDLSPIENVWGYVQSKAQAKGCKSFEEFSDSVKHILKNLPKAMLNNLYSSMKARLDECIKKVGGKTKY